MRLPRTIGITVTATRSASQDRCDKRRCLPILRPLLRSENACCVWVQPLVTFRLTLYALLQQPPMLGDRTP